MLYVPVQQVIRKQISHNLNTMADKAGIYYHLWRPEEINIKSAKEFTRSTWREFKIKGKAWVFDIHYNASNGWGLEHFKHICYIFKSIKETGCKYQISNKNGMTYNQKEITYHEIWNTKTKNHDITSILNFLKTKDNKNW